MVTIWLNTMPHPAWYANQVAAAPGLGSQSSRYALTSGVTSSSRNQFQVRKKSAASNARTSCNPRGRQSNVIDAEPVAGTTSWRGDPAFLTATTGDQELPGWQQVKGAPPGSEGATTPAPSPTEVNRRRIDVVHLGALERSSDSASVACDDADVATSRSSGHGVRGGRQKQRSFYSRPDMIKWRLFVEGVRSPINDDPESNRVRRVSQHLQDVILFLESLGLDSTKLMAKYPLLSTCSVENVRAVVRFLESHKLRRRDVMKLITNNPSLLSHSVQETFLPVITFLLTEVGLKEKDIGKVVIRCARLLTMSVDLRLRPTLRFLRTLGFTRMPIVVSNNATLLASSVENRLIPKMEFLQSLGLSKEETVQALIRFPAIFNYSVETNLQPKYSYLVDSMGFGLDDLKAFPQYFGYSLEYRIRPRHQFLKKRNISSSPLSDLLKPNDEVFYARFQHELLQARNESSSDKEPSCVV